MKGYDFYSIDSNIYDFLEYVHFNNITIYRLNNNKIYTFYSTLKYRKVLKDYPHISWRLGCFS